jgi:hypothetical protein
MKNRITQHLTTAGGSGEETQESLRQRDLSEEVCEYGEHACVVHREEMLEYAFADLDSILRDLRDLGLPPRLLAGRAESVLRRILREL